MAERHPSQRRRPGTAVARGEVHQQIGGLADQGAAVDLLARHHTSDGKSCSFRIDLSRETMLYGGLHLLDLSRCNDALCLPPPKVQVDAAKPKGVGPGPTPIDVPQEIACLRPRAGIGPECKESVVQQPRVEMDSALEAVETVIAQHDAECVFVRVG